MPTCELWIKFCLKPSCSVIYYLLQYEHGFLLPSFPFKILVFTRNPFWRSFAAFFFFVKVEITRWNYFWRAKYQFGRGSTLILLNVRFNVFLISLCEITNTMTSITCRNRIIITCNPKRYSDNTMSAIPAIVAAIRTKTVAIYSLNESSKLFFKVLSISSFSFVTPKYFFLLLIMFMCFFLIVFVYFDRVRSNTDVVTLNTASVINRLRWYL